MLVPPITTVALSACYSFDGDFTISGRPLKLSLERGAAALSHTGVTVWDAAIVFAKAVERQPSLLGTQTANRPIRVLELGAGTGAAGLSAALLGDEAVLTDLPELAETTERNIALNAAALAEAGGSASFSALDWAVGGLPDGPFDSIVAADPVWRVEQASMFAGAVHRAVVAYGCPMLLIRSERTCVSEASQALFAAFSEHGLVATAVDLLELGPLDLPANGLHFVQHGVVRLWIVR
mmetsp:Transcript_136880/g.292371  ORF Transcript_136880/g.292371 Transcript_136880/m.292371 type:complete len:237 (+) Transcript_136880:216-926(+)